MKKFYFFIVIGCLFTVMSCKHQCPSFNNDVLSWIPYQENDVVELYSESNDSIIKFSIKSVIVLHQTEYSNNSKCGTCDDQIEITQNPDDYFEFNVSMSLHKNKLKNQYYRIGGTAFTTCIEYAEYVIFGEEYDRVRVFEADVNQTFKTLFVVKGIGIVGLIDRDDQFWALKNAKAKESKTGEGIIFSETSC